MTTQTPTGARHEPRAMLALIALATDLPVPKGVTLYADNGILSMDFCRIVDGQPWSTYLGGRTDTYVNAGRRYLSEGLIEWRGWSVQLSVSEPVPPAASDTTLDAKTVTALTEVADT